MTNTAALRLLGPRAKNGLPRAHREDYNCWGLTAFVLGWEDVPWWLNSDEMMDHLRGLEHVDRPEIGDIVAWYDYFGLSHTAIVVRGAKDPGKAMVLHKYGSGPVETLTVEQVEDIYGEEEGGRLILRP